MIFILNYVKLDHTDSLKLSPYSVSHRQLLSLICSKVKFVKLNAFSISNLNSCWQVFRDEKLEKKLIENFNHRLRWKRWVSIWSDVSSTTKDSCIQQIFFVSLSLKIKISKKKKTQKSIGCIKINFNDIMTGRRLNKTVLQV